MFYVSKTNKLCDVEAWQIRPSVTRTALPERAVPGGLKPMGLQRLQPWPELFPWAFLSGAELATTRKGFAQIVFMSGWEEQRQDSEDRSGWKLSRRFSQE